ncbi:MAG: LysM peptidoglycan-binding domain-containing protein, partial [Anaerolineales bacterium]|nr:LysM peptidoglycan-binding domain-containing protein [Anaerolineales bacterium]
MGVASTPVESSREKTTRQDVLDIIRQYTNHLGLVVVALVVLFIARFGSNWNGFSINLPSTQVQVTLTPTMAPTGEAGVMATPAPTAIPDQTIRREVLPHTYAPNLPDQHLILHQVVEGDTPNLVAEEYGIEPATLLWGNPDLSNEAQLLQVGITLTILPVDGVLHTVGVSDTVDSLAEMYNVDPQVIIDYEDNNLKQWPHRPVPGTQLIIPGGEQSYLVWEYTPNSRQGTTSANA